MKLIIFLLLLSGSCQALKVLMYQIAFSNSHLPFSGAIADTLIDRGHVVDKIIMLYHSGVKTNGSTRLRNVYRIELDKPSEFMKSSHLVNPFLYTTFNRRDPGGIATRKAFCERLINNKALIKKLKAEQYDSLLIAPFDFCVFALNHLLKIPSVNSYSALAQDGYTGGMMGVPMPPSYVPQIFHGQILSENKNFWGRLRSLLWAVDVELDPISLGVEEYKFLKSKIPNLPSIREMFNTISNVFLNTNEVIDIPQPATAKTKYIGGIAMRPNDGRLPDEINEILSVPKPLVVFSFGSLIQSTSVPLDLKFQLLKAFSDFPEYTFIWKLHAEDPIRMHLTNFSNTRAVEWLPQIPLLNHPRTVAFITHAGMNSFLEASNAGVPLISIPFFVDQFYNAECMIRNKVGVYIDKQNLSTESMKYALTEVLYNPIYTQNAKEIAAMIRDRPTNPQNELITNLEYSAKHPRLAEVLRLESSTMSLWEYLCLDVIAGLLIAAVGSLALLGLVLKYLVRRLLGKKLKVD